MPSREPPSGRTHLAWAYDLFTYMCVYMFTCDPRGAEDTTVHAAVRKQPPHTRVSEQGKDVDPSCRRNRHGLLHMIPQEKPSGY